MIARYISTRPEPTAQELAEREATQINDLIARGGGIDYRRGGTCLMIERAVALPHARIHFFLEKGCEVTVQVTADRALRDYGLDWHGVKETAAAGVKEWEP